MDTRTEVGEPISTSDRTSEMTGRRRGSASPRQEPYFDQLHRN